MSETAISTAAPELEQLERRVQSLEESLTQEMKSLEERVVERVTAKMQGTIEKAVQAVPAALVPSPPPPPPPGRGGAPWLVFDIGREFKALVAMLFDMRFKLAWSTRVATMILVPYILCSHLIFPIIFIPGWIPVIGPLLEPVLRNLVNLVLAFVLYKALSRDLRRYYEWKGR